MTHETLGLAAYLLMFNLFDELEKIHPGISARVLASTKRNLEENPEQHREVLAALKVHFDQHGLG